MKIYSQSGLLMSVSGEVKNFKTQAPLSGVKVNLFKIENNEIKTSYTAISDSNGFYIIKYLEPGIYSFNIGYFGSDGIIIGSSARLSLNFYEIEIKDGKNLNMNIFIEEDSLFFDIEEIIDKVRGRVTKIFKFRNMDEPTLKETKKLNGMQSSGAAIMEFRKNIREEIVGDNEILPDGKDGLYTWIYSSTAKAICQPSSSKCIYTETIGILTGLLQMHTLQWSKDLPKNAGRSDAYIECFRNCLKLHEETHKNDSINYGEKYWQDEVINKLGQNDSCCDTGNCTSKQKKCLTSWATKSDNDMDQCSETNAKNAQRNCETQNNCAIK